MKIKTGIRENKLSKALAGMLALLLCLGNSMPAKAGHGTLEEPATAAVTKTLLYPAQAGITTPTVAFTFDFTKKSFNGSTSAEDMERMPAILQQEITFDSGDAGTVEGDLIRVTKETGDILAELDWSETGIYVYEVAELGGTWEGDGERESMTYSQATYELHVVVAYDSALGLYYVEQTMYVQMTDDEGNFQDNVKGDPDVTPGGEGNGFAFVNTFRTMGGPLTIRKQVEGENADIRKQFTYILKVNAAATESAAAVYTGYINEPESLETPVTIGADGSELIFTLPHDGWIEFPDLPAGTTYSLVELGEAGYMASYEGESGESTFHEWGALSEDLSLSQLTVGVNNNYVNFTNHYDAGGLIPTGILSNNLPFIALIVLVVLALVALAAVNRRKAVR